MFMRKANLFSRLGNALLSSTVFATSLMWGLQGLPAEAGPPVFENRVSFQNFQNLQTNWGYGPAENAYNDLIQESIQEHWTDTENPLNPKLFKALIAVESAFKTNAYSRTGCAGLVQLAPDTARRFGLSLSPVDERLIPEKAIPVGVQVMAEKQKVVLQPDDYYGILLGRPEKKSTFGTVVHRYYQKEGAPGGQDLLHLGFASYNGGGGTVMRAMAQAVKMGKNPLSWRALVGTGPADSPLFRACQVIYRGGAHGKYKEMSEYSNKIFSLLQED